MSLKSIFICFFFLYNDKQQGELNESIQQKLQLILEYRLKEILEQTKEDSRTSAQKERASLTPKVQETVVQHLEVQYRGCTVITREEDHHRGQLPHHGGR